MNSRWSDDLRERMAEYEAPAPEALFEQIMEAMPASQPASVVPLSGWRRWAAVAAAVAVVAGGYLLLDRPLQSEEELMAEVERVFSAEQNEVLAEVLTEELPPVAELAQATSQKRAAQPVKQVTVEQPSEQASAELLPASVEEKNTQPAAEKNTQSAEETRNDGAPEK